MNGCYAGAHMTLSLCVFWPEEKAGATRLRVGVEAMRSAHGNIKTQVASPSYP